MDKLYIGDIVSTVNNKGSNMDEVSLKSSEEWKFKHLHLNDNCVWDYLFNYIKQIFGISALQFLSSYLSADVYADTGLSAVSCFCRLLF